jgi:hypothetical protein
LKTRRIQVLFNYLMQTRRLIPMRSSRVYVKHYGSRLILSHSSLSDSTCFRKINLEGIKSSSYLFLSNREQQDPSFEIASKWQQKFLRKLKQLTKSRVDRDCGNLNRRDRPTASVERHWPQKKSEEYIGTSNPEQVQQGLDQLRRLVGVAQTLRAEGMVANCVAARSR